MSFEEFEANAYQEPGTGVYIVDGDIPLESHAKLKEFYDQHFQNGALIVNRVNSVDDRWSTTQKRSLSYCVSTAFGSRHDSVVQAMASAANDWQASADVRLIYDRAQDGNCTSLNPNVVFDVNPVNLGQYSARAFFPSYPRPIRNILIDEVAFGSQGPWTLTGILRHEIGHVLGFRHEHTRVGIGGCYEDGNWRPLTTYDSASVMHYPSCMGINTGDLVLTQKDRDGARALYGIALHFSLHTGTPLGETDDRWAFAIADNGDLFSILKSGTGTHSTEVHILSAASNYQSFSMHTGTALGETGGNWAFAVAANRDLVGILKSGTGTHSTEVHILSAASNYQSFSMHTGTALGETGGNWAFAVAANRDLVGILKSGTGTHSTEVHILSAASNYQSFNLHTGTPLEQTDDSWEFAVAANRDLVGVHKRNTGTYSTEVHVLSAANNYQSFSMHTGTPIEETDQSWQFLVSRQRDLVGVKKNGTGTRSTEVHIVDLP
ncbi:peptidase M10 [Cystobacter fuscus]|uniref:Peptidase M10 n=2 Tax=Cystobacter fuscus TaxID=43 RepID=A0A250JDR2_9BACT|nr:peptidase M10 [Cystobacter fuscus]